MGFCRLMGKPKYVTLYSGLKPRGGAGAGQPPGGEQHSPINSRLMARSLLVPQDQLDASRLETASQGLPRNARLGFELFDTPNWAGSDFTEKVNYQRALEGELERTLQTLSEVEAARVHLVMPHESLYSEQETRGESRGDSKDARRPAVRAERKGRIPQLVASAVEGLRRKMSPWWTPTATRRCCTASAPERSSPDLDEELGKKLCVPRWSRWSAPSTCAPACMWSTT